MKNIYVLLLFLLLTILATYPLIRHMETTLIESGDSLLNTWVISWDIKKLFSNPATLFHANIFYPYKYTLAYTEHMLGNALLGIPVYLITHNPILTYNFILLSTFVIGGWGMYLLVRHLTGSPLAGIIAGVIYIYNPYRFYALTHLHVLSIHWLPFTLLYIHRYFQTRRNRDLVLFCTFFTLQSATSSYIGLYQGFVICLFLFFVLANQTNIRVNHWLKLGLGLGICSLTLLPLYLPYIHLAKELNFIRPIEELKLYSATLKDFRRTIYPGATALLLAFLGTFHFRTKGNRHPVIVTLLNLCIFITLATIVYVIIYGWFNLGYTIFGIKLKVTTLKNPFFILLGLLTAKLLVQRDTYHPARFYLILAIASFLFCFGPEIHLKEVHPGPYLLLYNWFPGFKGLRVPSRWAVVFMLAIAVLAGLGWKKVEKWNWTKWTIYPVILILLLYGYISVPLTLGYTVEKTPPPVYQWLTRQDDNAVAIELPMPEWYTNFHHETIYMYWSLFHNKRIINGYSGYSPPTYWPIAELTREFPSRDSINLLQYLGVKYIILHNRLPEQKLNRYKDSLTLKYMAGTDSIYELTSTSTYQPELGMAPGQTKLLLLSKTHWQGLSSHNPGEIGYAYDNDTTTRWHTGCVQHPGIWLQLDLGKTVKINRITLHLGQFPYDYPRCIKLETSKTGKDWREIRVDNCYSKYIINLTKNFSTPKLDLDFNTTPARYIKLSVTGKNPVYYWSIYEIDVETPAPTSFLLQTPGINNRI